MSKENLGKFITPSNQKWWVLFGVSIASFMGCIDFTIVNTSLPSIQEHFHATVSELQWIINIFILALSSFMVVTGRLADLYGRRLVLYIGMILFALSSFGAGLATNMDFLILCRFIQGISCAVLYTSTGAIVSHAFPIEERGKAMGALFGVNGIGLAVGPMIGGFIVSTLSWRWIFLMNIPIVILSLSICCLSVRESYDEHSKPKIDWWGMSLLITGLLAFTLAVTQYFTWGASVSGPLLLFAIVIFALFSIVELKVKDPIIQFNLFNNRQFIMSAIATAVMAFFYCIALFLIPLYFHGVLNKTGYMLGFMLLPMTMSVAIFSPIIGRIVDKLGVKIALVGGLGLFALSAYLQTSFTQETSLFSIIIALIFMGIGWASVLGPSTVAAISSVPEHMGAIAMGSSWTIHNIGGVIGLAAGTAVYQLQAKKSLLADMALHQHPTDSWVQKVIENPDSSLQLLHQYTNLSSQHITSIFHNFFISGYQSSMWLLFAFTFASMVILMMGLKKHQPKMM